MSQAGYTPIQLYFSTTAAAVPVNTNLANGELAINITDGKLYYKDNTGTVKLLAGATAGPAGGSNTQVQFNSSGVLAGSANMTFNGTTLTVNDLTDSSLTAGRVTYAGASGNLVDSANLTFNGTTLTANTIGAFTLSGTIAGGGNQINNVIIGTTTPLAGAFTTLSAGNTTLTGTTALTLNRSGAAAQVALQNNGTSTGILIAGTTNGLVFYDAGAGLQMGTWAYSAGLAVTGNLTSTTAQFGTNPAGVSIGVIGIPNQKRIYGRNAANSADINILYVDGNNNVTLGPNDNATFTSTSLGIGTASPTRPLTISAVGAAYPSASNPSIRLDNSASGRFAVIESASDSNLYIVNGDADNASTIFRRGSGAGNESFRFGPAGQFGIGGATYGTAGQVLTSGGPSAAPTWAAGGGGGSVAGSNGQVQFNNSGSFGASTGLVWDNTNNRLSVNAGTSPTESLQVAGRIRMGTNYIVSDSVSSTFYISATGSDSTGTGTYANPWATLNKAMEVVPRFMPNASTNCTIILKNGTYTLSSVQYIRGITGGGTLYINAETAASVTVNLNGYNYEIERNSSEINFSGIIFNQPAIPPMFQITDTLRVTFSSNCQINNLTTTGTPGYFNQAIGVSNSGFTMACPLTITNESYYGAVINIFSGSRYAIQGTISKSGSRHGNAAVSIQGNAEGQLQSTINNFAIGVNMGRSHYDAETFGIAVANGLSCTNCTIGIQLANGGNFKSYYIASFSGTTTPVSFINGWYSGTASSEYNLLGYTTSVSSSYRLQVNSQIYATSSTIATSDGRYKKNVAVIANGLDIVKALRPVQFDWIPHDIHNFDTEHTTVGFIAQEVQEVLAGTAYVDSIIKPHYITREAEEYDTVIITPATEEIIDADGTVISLAAPPVTEKRITKPAVTEEFFGIAEGNLIAILTKAIQEQQAIIEALTARVEALEAK